MNYTIYGLDKPWLLREALLKIVTITDHNAFHTAFVQFIDDTLSIDLELTLEDLKEDIEGNDISYAEIFNLYKKEFFKQLMSENVYDAVSVTYLDDNTVNISWKEQ